MIFLTKVQLGRRQVLLLLGAAAGLGVVSLAVKNLVVRWRLRKLPGLRNYPVLGSSLEMARVSKNKEPFEVLMSMSRRFENEPAWVIWRGLRPVVIIQSGASMEPILTSSTYIGKAHNLAREFLGNSLFHSTGQTWRNRRKLMAPAFQMEVLKSFKDQIHLSLMDAVAQVAEHKGAPFDLQALVGQTAFDHLLDTLFAFDGKWSDSISKDLRKELFSVAVTLLTNNVSKLESFTCRLPILGPYTSIMATERRCLTTIIEKTKYLIEIKKEHRKKEVLHPPRLIHLLLDELERPDSILTLVDVIVEIVAFVYAGSHTTASALTWAFFQLALHQDVQDKLRTELLQRFKPDAELSLEELNALPYLDCVIKECLRLLPPIPMVSRSDHAIAIPLNNGKTVTIPANVEVDLFIAGAHRYKQAWGVDADVFDPDRFLDPARDARNDNVFNFMPFSVGLRGCIGQRYGDYFLKAFIAQLLMNYKINTSLTLDTVKPYLAATLFAKNGLLVTANQLT
ncbi:Cytochrome P450 4V2 [Cichlidogyrus casuarinus]|uniref:Cytochrome P450 4V2 n=1 Tax=Cichlidogyrus casuarinus TaxID=1844966 RepID=A0ABD2PPY3_9PLAT